MKDNIYPGAFKIDQKARSKALGQKPFLIWFTGLSGSGKSTLANGTEAALHRMGYHTYLLDGDNIRNGLSKDLSFSKQGRSENIRRIAEVSKLMLDAGLIVVCAFISPFIDEREMIRNLVGKEKFLEIYVDCPLEICEQRDVKGLYQKARKGLISNFTGIDSPYEAPKGPFMVIKSAEENLNASIKRIIKELEKKIKF